MKSASQRLLEKIKENFPELVGETFVGHQDPQKAKAVLKFLKKVDEAKRRTGKSKLRFGEAA